MPTNIPVVFETEPLAVKAEKACKLLGCSRTTLWQLTKERKVRRTKYGSYPVAELHRHLIVPPPSGVLSWRSPGSTRLLPPRLPLECLYRATAQFCCAVCEGLRGLLRLFFLLPYETQYQLSVVTM